MEMIIFSKFVCLMLLLNWVKYSCGNSVTHTLIERKQWINHWVKTMIVWLICEAELWCALWEILFMREGRHMEHDVHDISLRWKVVVCFKQSHENWNIIDLYIQCEAISNFCLIGNIVKICQFRWYLQQKMVSFLVN